MALGKPENQFSDYQMSFNKSIVILAGGLGSRYKGLKQIDGITDNGSPILEYSMYDAIAAGFNKVVIIVNRQIPVSYIERLEEISIKNKIEFEWIYQDISDFVPDDFELNGREKPWGTAHALLCVKDLVQENLVVLNADDYYGKEIYQQAADIINNDLVLDNQYHIIAYPLYKTLSENGSVSRGICEINPDQTMKQVTERTQILKRNSDIYFIENQQETLLSPNTLVSMNFSIFNPSIFKVLELYFNRFLDQKPEPKEEFFIPKVIQDMIDENRAKTAVHTALSNWMGVTYPEDKANLKSFLEQEIINGRYPKNLWN